MLKVAKSVNFPTPPSSKTRFLKNVQFSTSTETNSPALNTPPEEA